MEDLIHRAAILLAFTDEHDAAEVLMAADGTAAEDAYLAVKAAQILNQEPQS